MSELEMKTEVEDFSDELSDEALDRAEGARGCWWSCDSSLRPPASCGGRAGPCEP